jgi:hypothetical protein
MVMQHKFENTAPQPPRRRLILYTVPQVAGDAKVSERFIWKLIAAGKIKTVNLGLRCTRITEEERERIVTEGVQ